MLSAILSILLTAVAVALVAHFIPGIKIKDFKTALTVSVVYSLLQFFFLKLLVILTLPITLITFGLFIFVLNAILLTLTNELVEGFEIKNFKLTVVAAAAISILSGLLRWILF